MRRPRLYCPSLAQDVVTLPPEEARHACNVLRIRTGDEVIVFDGQGHEAVGRVLAMTARSAAVQVRKVEPFPFECGYRITLAVAVVKAHRQSYLVEKCTELGLAAIWPIVTERTVVKPREAALDKWARRALEASKQAGRRWVPTINPVQTFDEALQSLQHFRAAFIAAPEQTDSLFPGAFSPEAFFPKSRASARAISPPSVPFTGSLVDELRALPSDSEILVFVGPEGGWTDAELQAADAAGAMRIALATTTLRVETAAVAVCAAAAMAGLCATRAARNPRADAEEKPLSP
ncbi:MAG: RsmE family RNA methyltransferase [Planctomycetota bacterium]